MDMKQQLDKMFEDREARQQAMKDEANAKAQAESARRAKWINFINTTLTPVLNNYKRIVSPDAEAGITIDQVSPVVGASVNLRLYTSDRNSNIQPSRLTITFLDTARFKHEIWGRNGNNVSESNPDAATPEAITGETIERQLVLFTQSAINNAE